MSIKVTCSACGTTLKAKDSLAGKKVKCPHCSEAIRIPDASAEEEVYEAEEVGDNQDFDFGGLDPSAGEEIEGRKPCPVCGEMIMRTAAKCRYCGEIFDPALKKREKKKKRSGEGADIDIDEDMTTGDWVVALICSGIGCIVGIVWMIQGKPKGPKMFGVSLGMTIFWNIIRAAIEIATEQNNQWR